MNQNNIQEAGTQTPSTEPLWDSAVQGNTVVDGENTAMAIAAVNEKKADQIALAEKFFDVMTPGAIVEFDPAEAEQAGAFVEDALNEEDAWDSIIDNGMVEHG